MMQPTPAPSQPPRSPRAEPDSGAEYYTQPPRNVGSAPFHVLSELFNKLTNEKNSERKRKFIRKWFDSWRKSFGYDLYPVLRLILPHKDRERAVYGLKEKNLAKSYIKLIPLNPKDPDALRLMHWKKPTEKNQTSGDFPTVLYDVVSKRSSVIEGTLTIDELNNILDEISKHSGKHDVQSKLLQKIYNRTTPEEQKWIVRIILKDMNISVKETTVFSVFHDDAQDLFNTCSDLKKVAWDLWDSSRRLNADEKSVQIFKAFAPMLCKRPTRKVEETVKEMQGQTFYIEEKLDGERIQLHKRRNEYFYCSRKGKDYTYLYGQNVGTGSLTPFIDSSFDERIDDIILDGEMLVWDPVSERNLPFGTLKTAALDRSKKEHNPRPCFKVFDLLYLNGRSLIDKSLKFRKANLRACIKEIPGRIEFTQEYQGKLAKDVRDRMDLVMADRGEGLVIKHPGSEYVLNGRNKDWIKVKPEYMDNMGETMDLLVVSGYYGSGKRSGGVSTIVCAVLDDRVQGRYDDEDEPQYSTFVRIGSGFSFADYVWIRDKPWKVWDPRKPPTWLKTAKKGFDDKGDLYLEPEDSFVVKVKAAEITATDAYDMGFTMRFPRAMAIRDDLTVADCMTATGVLASMRQERKRKMESDAGMTTNKKKKTNKKEHIMVGDVATVNKKNIEVISEIFEGMNFVVVSDPKKRAGEQEKKQLAEQIIANGGTYFQVAHGQPSLTIIYNGSTQPFDVKQLMKKYDILRPRWVHDSIKLGEPAPLKRKYFFYAQPARMETEEYVMEGDNEADEEAMVTVQPSEDRTNIKDENDEVADRLTDPPTPQQDDRSETEADSDNEDVREELDVAEWSEDEREPAVEDAEEKPEAEVKMGDDDEAMEYDQDLIFKHLCFYIDSPENARKHDMTVKAKNESKIAESLTKVLKLITDNGGKIVDLANPKLTHIVLDSRDITRRKDLMNRTSKPKMRHLVIADFIQACMDEETLLDEAGFAP